MSSVTLQGGLDVNLADTVLEQVADLFVEHAGCAMETDPGPNPIPDGTGDIIAIVRS